jgi:hypothetical protein
MEIPSNYSTIEFMRSRRLRYPGDLERTSSLTIRTISTFSFTPKKKTKNCNHYCKILSYFPLLASNTRDINLSSSDEFTSRLRPLS